MTSLLKRIAGGVIAGTVGTLAMDLVWYLRYRQGGGDESFTDWEFATSTASFEDASAPGKAGKKLADKAGVDVPDEAAGVTTNVMHWTTGLGYGVSHGLLQHDRGVLTASVVTGTGAFANSYATMGAMGIYQPIWEYDAKTLWKDYTAHLVFGLATALAYKAITNSSDDG